MNEAFLMALLTRTSTHIASNRTSAGRSTRSTQARRMADAVLRVQRDGKMVPLPVKDGWVYDPGYMNTAVCTSSITYIEGVQGILRYRGYPIEQLAERSSSFLEAAFLLLYGELPSPDQLGHFTARIRQQQAAPLHTDLVNLLHTIRHDAHCMVPAVSALAAMGALHPEANPALAGMDIYQRDPSLRESQIFFLLGTFPTLAAHILLRRAGCPPYSTPLPSETDGPLSYTEHFLALLGMGKAHPTDARPDPRVVRALDTVLLVHADHELNCSTAALRHLASSGVDVYSAVSGATAALYGPLHGGATEAVLKMLQGIGSVEKVPAFLQAVKEKRAKLMGFGHRVYKNFDPRGVIVRKLAYDVFQVYGSDPLIHLATALEKAARADDYFVSRKLYPNIDFYSGLIYKAIGFPTDFFPVLFAMGRMAGWLAHWNEFMAGPAAEQKIVRPRQIYKGSGERPYVELMIRDRAVRAPGYNEGAPLPASAIRSRL